MPDEPLLDRVCPSRRSEPYRTAAARLLGTIRSLRHRHPSLGVPLGAVGAAVLVASTLGLPAVPAAASSRQASARATATGTAPFPDGLVHLDGHGWGPGVGMGQWGAFGYAADQHKTYQWILSHFYGGTTLTAGGDPYISVGIIEDSGKPVVVTSASKFRLGGVVFPAGTAGKAVLHTLTGIWTIKEASSCSASRWTTVRTVRGQVQAVPSSQQPSAPAGRLLTICRADGVQMTVRGLVRGLDYTSSGSATAETVNFVPLDEYVADVVPSESSAGWGEVGGTNGAPGGEPWGFQSLEAQAVAARTYTLAYIAGGGWGGWADICDSDWCQTYPGVLNETAISTAATNDTAGQYLELGGSPAPTQYSASTGGWTVTSRFPAVEDAGDSVCLTGTSYWTCNPDHSWATTIAVTSVESQFPGIGSLLAVHVISRNGLGQWGGRALWVKIRGTKGSVFESGDTFQSQFSLASDWFLVAHPVAPASITSRSVASPRGAAGMPSAARRGAVPLFEGTGPLPSRVTALRAARSRGVPRR